MADNGWNEYQKLILSKLDTHGASIRGIRKELTNVRIELEKLKVKSGIWGMVGGMIPIIAWLILKK